MKAELKTVALKTGTDDAPVVERDPACYDLADFYERTDCITQWGAVTAYDNELTKRFVDTVVVKDEGIEVKFKAGISVEVGK